MATYTVRNLNSGWDQYQTETNDGNDIFLHREKRHFSAASNKVPRMKRERHHVWQNRTLVHIGKNRPGLD